MTYYMPTRNQKERLMSQTPDDGDKEFAAIQTIYGALRDLDDDAKIRVMEYVSSRLGITTSVRQDVPAPVSTSTSGHPETEGAQPTASEETTEEATRDHLDFEYFGELFDAADPQTEAERALVTAYWLQICESTDSVTSHAINKELKHLGYELSNVTRAIDDLRKRKPAPVILLRKSGTSKQARKTFKVTEAGEKAVKGMLNG